MIEEIWKPIKGYEGLYEVSSLGRVKSLQRIDNNNHSLKEKIMIQHNKYGYQTICLSKHGKHQYFRVHRLVAQAFIPNPNNYTIVNHIDENKQNNCVDNLEWCTQKYNVNHGTSIEKIKQHHSKPVYQYTMDGNLIHKWDSCMDIHRKLGYSQGNISACARGERNSCGGYIWKYAS